MTSEMRRPRHSLNDLLADAEVLADEYTKYDTAASRRRVERDIADTLWHGSLYRESVAQTAQVFRRDAAMPFRGGVPRLSPHAWAADDLRALSTLVIADPHAAQHIDLLVSFRQIEPNGALIFGCLLHLADRQEGAQFWWQFAAGAGSITSALCLYLMHQGRGELRDADHWGRQAAELEHLAYPPDCYSRISSVARQPAPHGSLLSSFHQAPCEFAPRGGQEPESFLFATVPWRPPAQLPDSAGSPSPLSRSLTLALHRLEAHFDLDYGTVPLPAPELAAQLQHCGAAPS